MHVPLQHHSEFFFEVMEVERKPLPARVQADYLVAEVPRADQRIDVLEHVAKVVGRLPCLPRHFVQIDAVDVDFRTRLQHCQQRIARAVTDRVAVTEQQRIELRYRQQLAELQRRLRRVRHRRFRAKHQRSHGMAPNISRR